MNLWIKRIRPAVIILIICDIAACLYLCLNVYSEGTTRYKVMLSSCYILAFLICFYATGYRTVKPEVVFALLVFVAGLFYMFTLTPFCVADEETHYRISYKLSNILMFRFNDPMGCSTSDFSYAGFEAYHNTLSGYDRIIKELGGRAEVGLASVIPGDFTISYAPMHLPQALGITAGRLMRRNMVTNIMLGRLFNLLFYGICVFHAVRIAPVYKSVLGCAAAVSAVIQDASMLSHDTYINGISLLMTALFIRMALGEGTVRKKDFVAFAVLGILLSPAKMVYFPFIFLPLLIDKDKFEGGKKKYVAVVLICAFIGMVLIYLCNLSDLRDIEDGSNLDFKERYTFDFVISHPAATLKLYLRSTSVFLKPWISEAMVTDVLRIAEGWTRYITLAFMAILLLSAADGVGQTEPHISGTLKIGLLAAAFIMYSFILVAMLIAWTNGNSDVILGVHGRYFDPLIPLILLGINIPKMHFKKPHTSALAITTAAVHGAVLLPILCYTV